MKHILLIEDDLSLIDGLEFSLHRQSVIGLLKKIKSRGISENIGALQ